MELFLYISAIANIILLIWASVATVAYTDEKENVRYWKDQHQHQLDRNWKLVTKYDKLRTKLAKLSGVTKDSSKSS